MAPHRTSPLQISQRERQATAVRLRASGLRYDEIARQLGYNSEATARSAVASVIRKLPIVAGTELREMEVIRLDALLHAVWDKALAGQGWAIDRALKIIHQKCQLLGLNAPVKTEVSGPDGAPIQHDVRARLVQYAPLIQAIVGELEGANGFEMENPSNGKIVEALPPPSDDNQTIEALPSENDI